MRLQRANIYATRFDLCAPTKQRRANCGTAWDAMLAVGLRGAVGGVPRCCSCGVAPVSHPPGLAVRFRSWLAGRRRRTRSPSARGQGSPTAPHARKALRTDKCGGRFDEYAWMRDRGSPELAQLVRAENGFSTAMLRDVKATAQRMERAITARTAGSGSMMRVDRDGASYHSHGDVPELCRGYWYWSDVDDHGSARLLRCRAGQGVDAIVPPLSFPAPGCGPVETLLDFGELGNMYDYVLVGSTSISPDDAMLGFTLDTVGDEKFSGVVRRLGSSRDAGVDLVTESVPATSRLTWANIGAPHVLYYTLPDERGIPKSVWRRTMGTPHQDNECVWDANDEEFLPSADADGVYVDCVPTKDHEILTINANSKSTSGVWIVDARDRSARPQLVASREPGVQYFVEHNNVR